MPACAQACPTRAITFGDSNDPASAMMRRREDNRLRSYRALEELNTQPAITYLRDLYRDERRKPEWQRRRRYRPNRRYRDIDRSVLRVMEPAGLAYWAWVGFCCHAGGASPPHCGLTRYTRAWG